MSCCARIGATTSGWPESSISKSVEMVSRPGRRHDAGADVAEAVDVVARLDFGREVQHLIGEQVDPPGWMDVQRQQHRGGLGAFVGQLVSGADSHIDQTFRPGGGRAGEPARFAAKRRLPLEVPWRGTIAAAVLERS